MATFAQWVSGSRPRTWGTALAPVAVGSGLAGHYGNVNLLLALGVFVMCWLLTVGVNFANDYSDGVRGVDDERVGPGRLVASGAAQAEEVLVAGWVCFIGAILACWALAIWSGHVWLLLVAPVGVAAAWFYTGGDQPYGYRGWGEVSVFVFYGPVGVVTASLVQAQTVGEPTVAASVGAGVLAAAVLLVNNVRDLPTDARAGKRTLAVLVGDHGARTLYVVLLIVAVGCTFWLAGLHPPALAGLAATPFMLTPAAVVLSGAAGRDLVPVLGYSVLVLLVWSATTTFGLLLP